MKLIPLWLAVINASFGVLLILSTYAWMWLGKPTFTVWTALAYLVVFFGYLLSLLLVTVVGWQRILHAWIMHTKLEA